MAMMMEEAVVVTGEIVPAMPTLAEAEAVIERVREIGRHCFLDIGKQLGVIEQNELWKESGQPTFRKYVEVRWDYTERHARRMIAAVEVVLQLAPGPVGPVLLDITESQARELVPLRDKPKELAQAWTKANEVADAKGVKVTAAITKKAVATFLPAPPKPKTRRGIGLKTAMKDQNKIKVDFCTAWNLAGPELKSWIFEFVHSNIVV